MAEVSVVIPVYNVEEYLSACLDSVLNQTYRDIEIVCVDDGSSDGSLEILKKYEKLDNRIIVISQPNKGVSSARNVALDCLSGKYVVFCDSDDTFEPDLIEKSVCEIKKNDDDIVIFGMNIIKNNIKKVRHDIKILEENSFYSDDLEVIMSLSHNVCNKMFKTEFLKKHSIKFIENIKTIEDGIFCVMCVLNKAKIRLLPFALYNYVVDRENSATNNKQNVVKNDIQAFFAFEHTGMLNNLDDETFLVVIKKFLSGLWVYYGEDEYRNIYRPQIKSFLSYLEKTYGKSRLQQLKLYRKLQNELGLGGFLKQIFSIYNKDDFKFLRILGLKIKIRENRERVC